MLHTHVNCMQRRGLNEEEAFRTQKFCPESNRPVNFGMSSSALTDTMVSHRCLKLENHLFCLRSVLPQSCWFSKPPLVLRNWVEDNTDHNRTTCAYQHVVSHVAGFGWVLKSHDLSMWFSSNGGVWGSQVPAREGSVGASWDAGISVQQVLGESAIRHFVFHWCTSPWFPIYTFFLRSAKQYIAIKWTRNCVGKGAKEQGSRARVADQALLSLHALPEWWCPGSMQRQMKNLYPKNPWTRPLRRGRV